MIQNPEAKSEEQRINDLRLKRMESLISTYKNLTRKFPEIAKETALHPGYAAATVEEYLSEWKLLRIRDKIDDRIQWHKIAGLMAMAISNHRPIQLTDPTGCSNPEYNEIFAIYHGLAICSEGVDEERVQFLFKSPYFSGWFDAFKRLLRSGGTSKESLVQIFHTVSIANFPENLATDYPSAPFEASPRNPQR